MRKLRTIRFGQFDYLPEVFTLFRDGKPVPIGSRATAVLHRLLQEAGSNVAAAELILSAWPETFVEDCNLRQQVAILRRAIDAPGMHSHIRNAPGRGYAFVMPVEHARLSLDRDTKAGDNA